VRLLCTESDIVTCKNIISLLAEAGINAELRQRTPSLFDTRNQDRTGQLYEIWAASDEDAERANAILYPEPAPEEE
jgi:hypothetical protein